MAEKGSKHVSVAGGTNKRCITLTATGSKNCKNLTITSHLQGEDGKVPPSKCLG